MSEGERHMPDREGLAAEYVLGTLPHAERLAAEALIAADANFAALVAEWEARLSPLNQGYRPETPPAALKRRIDARLFPAPVVPWRVRWRWHIAAALGAAVAALVLVFYVPATRPGPLVTAELRGENQALVIDARYDPEARELRVERSAGPAAEPGKDYELWIIPAGQDAISLGLIRAGERRIPLDVLPAGATLAVTLEREGGAPTGVAEGPVLVAAVIGG